MAHVSGKVKLQLVRMDGQFLQTLYCGSPAESQWSADQRLMLFSDSGHIYLLNVTNGTLQVEVSFIDGETLHPRTWLDTTRAYLTSQLPDGPLTMPRTHCKNPIAPNMAQTLAGKGLYW